MLWSGQGRAGQVRSGQVRSGQVRSGQGRAGQGRAGQGRAGQGRAGQGRADLMNPLRHRRSFAGLIKQKQFISPSWIFQSWWVRNLVFQDPNQLLRNTHASAVMNRKMKVWKGE